jgi:hypothetical protein
LPALFHPTGCQFFEAAFYNMCMMTMGTIHDEATAAVMAKLNKVAVSQENLKL